VKRRMMIALSMLLVLGWAGLAAMRASASAERITNVEVRIVSQSCFQGEVTPCG